MEEREERADMANPCSNWKVKKDKGVVFGVVVSMYQIQKIVI